MLEPLCKAFFLLLQATASSVRALIRRQRPWSFNGTQSTQCILKPRHLR